MLGVTGTVKKAAGRWLSRDNSINRLRTSRPALVAELEHDSKESEQKARAQGIQKVITSFMFVASLYFFSDIMPQLNIFCKTLQAVDISLEGVLAAYQLTRATLHAYKSGIDSMPFLRRFVASVMTGGVLNLTLHTTAAVGSADFRAYVADQVSKWDKAVRVPFLGHMVQELFDVFGKTEPVMKALLLLTTPALA